MSDFDYGDNVTSDICIAIFIKENFWTTFDN